MLWILIDLLFISFSLGIVYPLAAAIIIKINNFRKGKRSTFKQIFDAIGF